MKFLVVGLGSMGKRRVRNLQALGYADIAGTDLRPDRLEEARGKYGIATFDDFDTALAEFGPDALVISTSPESHMRFAYAAYDKGIAAFIEASVTDRERIRELAGKTAQNGPVILPSTTMTFYPGPRAIEEIVIGEKRIGKVLAITYHTGQYLPDWHPWEPIADFYVSRRETGGCREIVPFELTWLNRLFGDPEVLSATVRKLSDLDADIDDLYTSVLQYPGGTVLNLTVEVLSRPDASRILYIVGSEGALVWNDEGMRYKQTSDSQWQQVGLSSGHAESGYINPEEPYIAEMKAFVAAVEGNDPSLFPNSLEEDYRILSILEKIDEVSRS